MKIVVAEKIAPAALELLREESRWQVVPPEQAQGPALARQVQDADALLVRSAVQVDSALLDGCTRLRVIGRAGVGVDNIDLAAATKKGIAVMNTPGANAPAVAEHTLAMMLALARHLVRAHESTRAGRWEKKSLQGTELRGKTLGIVGLGRIGIEVARRARAFRVRVMAHDPFVSPAAARESEIELVGLEELFRGADYLSLHVGLTSQTAGIINAKTLAKMKKGVRLINCARGELVDEAALAAALRSGQVGAAALDVFADEPPAASPLLSAPNVLLTPHIAGSTQEAQDAVGVQIAQQVREYLKRGVIQNAVNVPSLTHEEYAQVQPYIVLAEKLGSFLAQAGDGTLQEISLRYSGPLAEWKTELVRNAAVKGILNQLLSEQANIVNAAQIAAERGIQLHEARKPRPSAGGSGNVLSISLKTSAGERLAKGAVLHGKFPRLLALDGIDIEAPLERNLIYLRNRDVPGVIGRVGTLLGRHRINIANFALGRGENARGAASARQAIAVIQVDSRVPEEVLQRLRKFEEIASARAMRL